MSRKRFLHLERERAEEPKPTEPNDGDDAPPPGRSRVSERFGSDPRAPGDSAPQRTAGTGMRPERFEAEPDPQLGIEERDPDALPYARCVHCQTDNSRFVDACARCGNSLHSPEQRAYDAELTERYRASRQEEEEQLRALRAGRGQGQEGVQAQIAEANRSYGEALAKRERERMEWELATDGEGDAIGMRLLRAIPSPHARWAVIAGLIGLAALPWLVAANTSQRFLLRIASLVVVLLFAPPRWLSVLGSSRRRWW